jgi:hypothetical protein
MTADLFTASSSSFTEVSGELVTVDGTDTAVNAGLFDDTGELEMEPVYMSCLKVNREIRVTLHLFHMLCLVDLWLVTTNSSVLLVLRSEMLLVLPVLLAKRLLHTTTRSRRFIFRMIRRPTNLKLSLDADVPAEEELVRG